MNYLCLDTWEKIEFANFVRHNNLSGFGMSLIMLQFFSLIESVSKTGFE